MALREELEKENARIDAEHARLHKECVRLIKQLRPLEVERDKAYRRLKALKAALDTLED